MKRYKSSGAAAIVTALTAVGALGFVSAVPANASPNYFDNWPGNVVLDYQSPGGPLATNLQDWPQSSTVTECHFQRRPAGRGVYYLQLYRG